MNNIQKLDMRGNPVEKISKFHDHCILNTKKLECLDNKEIKDHERKYLFGLIRQRETKYVMNLVSQKQPMTLQNDGGAAVRMSSHSPQLLLSNRNQHHVDLALSPKVSQSKIGLNRYT